MNMTIKEGVSMGSCKEGYKGRSAAVLRRS